MHQLPSCQITQIDAANLTIPPFIYLRTTCPTVHLTRVTEPQQSVDGAIVLLFSSLQSYLVCQPSTGPAVMKVDVRSRFGRSLIDGGLTLPDQACMHLALLHVMRWGCMRHATIYL